ncbi:MAG TPA: cytochrome P450, partial [Pyrinomonadaceae bacterium]|nr:cytochrome P450 [Pyrinomonadaceae bacterium]
MSSAANVAQAAPRVPPGPKGSLLLGVMPEFNADSLAFITRCRRDYGDVVRARFLYVNVLFLYNPEHVEYMLVSGNKNFRKPLSLNSPFFKRIVGNGLISSEGDFWLRQRRLAQPAFHRERLAAYADTTVAYTERLVGGWRDGEPREIHAEMMRLTLEVVAKLLFDADVTKESGEIGRILGFAVKPFGSQATLKWIADNRLPTPLHIRFNRAVRRLDEIIYRIIAERRANGGDRADLLSMLLRAQDEDGTRMTDKQLRDEAMTLFLAGHETTAIALSWAWYLLSQ